MKKIKLPLEMANGVMVRSLDELKENWDLEKIVSHYGDGSLVTWLNDRYYTDLAEQVEKITATGVEAQKQLCAIFGMEFKQDEVVDAEAVAERKRKLDILRQFTSDDEVLKNVDHVAFNQEDLADLLDEGVERIYLCNGKFSVPLNISGKKYIGVADAEVYIGKDELIDFDKLEISFENVMFDEKYSRLLAEGPTDTYALRQKAKIYIELCSSNYTNEEYQQGIKILKDLCGKNDKQAYYDLGMAYWDEAMYYRDIANDNDKFNGMCRDAKELFLRAIECGNYDGYYGLYLTEYDSDEEKIKHVQRGFELGSMECTEQLCYFYRRGAYVARDLGRAMHLAMQYKCWIGVYYCYVCPSGIGSQFVECSLYEANKYLIKAVKDGDHEEYTLAYNYRYYLNDTEEAAAWAQKGYEQEEDLVEAIKCFNFLSSLNMYSSKRGYINSMTYQKYLETREKFVKKLADIGLERKCIDQLVETISKTEFAE